MSGPRGCALCPWLQGVMGANECQGLHLFCGHRGQWVCPEVDPDHTERRKRGSLSGGGLTWCVGRTVSPGLRPALGLRRHSGTVWSGAGWGVGGIGRGASRGGAARRCLSSSRILGITDAAAAALPGSPLSPSLGPEWLKGGFSILCTEGTRSGASFPPTAGLAGASLLLTRSLSLLG